LRNLKQANRETLHHAGQQDGILRETDQGLHVHTWLTQRYTANGPPRELVCHPCRPISSSL